MGSHKHQGIPLSLNKHAPEILSHLGILPQISEEAGFQIAVVKSASLQRLSCLSRDCKGIGGMAG